jgi:hypothetical protein
MFGMLKGLGAEKKPSPFEVFGKVKIERRLGLEVLRATPERCNRLQSLRDRLSSMTCLEKDDLIDGIFARLALFVFDLPASEANHHSERFGLFDHLLEVACQTARELSGPGFQTSPDASVHRHEGPLWVYAGVIAAIAHDIGKPLDLEVVAPGDSTPWDPLGEPLRLFCERNRLPGTGPGLWHFKKGRGTRTHEKNILVLLPMVLTPRVDQYLGPRLSSVLRALTTEEAWSVPGGVSHPSREVIRVMRRMDQATSILDHETRHPKTARPTAGFPPTVLEEPVSRPIPQGPPVALTQAAPPAGAPGTPTGRFQASPTAMPLEAPAPLLIPRSEWMRRIPALGKRRGDPTETARRLAFELQPPHFLHTLHRLILQRKFDRNSLYSEVYLRPNVVWLVVPEALRLVSICKKLPWDTDVVANMLRSLRALPQVEPQSVQELAFPIKTRPDSRVFYAIRINPRGFLSESELTELGLHDCEVKVLDAGIPKASSPCGATA